MHKLLLAMVLLLFGFPHVVNANAVQVKPGETAEEYVYANHQISNLFLSRTEGNFIILLDDGSAWDVSPQDKQVVEDLADHLLGSYVSVMPTAANPESKRDHRLIVHAYGERIPLDVNIVSYCNYGIRKITSIGDRVIQVSNGIDGSVLNMGLFDDSLDVFEWEVGDPVLVGGVWFKEFDAQQRTTPDCVVFALYNYRSGKFVLYHDIRENPVEP